MGVLYNKCFIHYLERICMLNLLLLPAPLTPALSAESSTSSPPWEGLKKTVLKQYICMSHIIFEKLPFCIRG